MGNIGGGGGVVGSVLEPFIGGGESRTQRALREFSTKGLGSKEIQQFLPPALRSRFVNPFLESGIEGIGELLMSPGGLSPSVSEAILPRLATESEAIGQNFRNLRSEQAGAAARGNVPVSIKNALQGALGIGEERAQRETRRAALTESEALRRRDLDQVFRILDAILQFTSAGRGQAIQGLAATPQRDPNFLETIGTLIGGLRGTGGGGGGGSASASLTA